MPSRPRTHRPSGRKPPTENRASAHERGYDWRWRRFRKAFLAEHPLCIRCEAEGRLVSATEVDHRIPHKGDMAKFWVGPFDPLCSYHHKVKTATEDGGGFHSRNYPREEG